MKAAGIAAVSKQWGMKGVIGISKALEKASCRESKAMLVAVLLSWVQVMLQDCIFQGSSTVKAWAACAAPFPVQGTTGSWQSGLWHGLPAACVPFCHFLDSLLACLHSLATHLSKGAGNFLLFFPGVVVLHTLCHGLSLDLLGREKEGIPNDPAVGCTGEKAEYGGREEGKSWRKWSRV